MALQGPLPIPTGKQARPDQALLTRVPATHPSGKSQLPGAQAKLSGAQKPALLVQTGPLGTKEARELAQGHIANQGLSWDEGSGPLTSRSG